MNNVGTMGVADNATQYTMVSINNNACPFAFAVSPGGDGCAIVSTEPLFKVRSEFFTAKSCWHLYLSAIMINQISSAAVDKVVELSFRH